MRSPPSDAVTLRRTSQTQARLVEVFTTLVGNLDHEVVGWYVMR